MCNLCDNYKVDVPEGERGDWAVRRFEVSQQDADLFNLRCAINRRMGGTICVGTYTKLENSGSLVMSDTPSEIRDHLWLIRNAKGRVLLGGMGLGMVLSALCRKDDVEHVTVVEKSMDVIRLVGNHWKSRFGQKVEIVRDDIFEWKPKRGSKWDYSWFDVWNDICEDNLKEMSMLQKKFAKRSRIKGFWSKDKLT